MNGLAYATVCIKINHNLPKGKLERGEHSIDNLTLNSQCCYVHTIGIGNQHGSDVEFTVRNVVEIRTFEEWEHVIQISDGKSPRPLSCLLPITVRI